MKSISFFNIVPNTQPPSFSCHIHAHTQLEGTTLRIPRNAHFCDMSVRDEHSQLLDVHVVSNSSSSSMKASPGLVVATSMPSDPNAFRLNYLANNHHSNNDDDNNNNNLVGDHPILEYTCGDAVRPVPMVC